VLPGEHNALPALDMADFLTDYDDNWLDSTYKDLCFSLDDQTGSAGCDSGYHS
jgi:hypothetical protein